MQCVNTNYNFIKMSRRAVMYSFLGISMDYQQKLLDPEFEDIVNVCLFAVLRRINSISVIQRQQFTNLCFLDYS